MFRDYTLQTTKGRALVALAGGTYLAAIVNSVIYTASFYFPLDKEYVPSHQFLLIILIFTKSIIAWSIGLLAIGVPIWILFHKTKLRTWGAALLLGIGLPLSFSFLTSTRLLTGLSGGNFSLYAYGGQIWQDGTLTDFGWQVAVWVSAFRGLQGAFVALTIWRIAYRRPAEDV